MRRRPIGSLRTAASEPRMPEASGTEAAGIEAVGTKAGGAGTLPKRLYLYDMTWPEVKTALPGVKVAIIPTGSTEQHGPHGTFEVDTARAREFSLRLADRVYPSALVTPCVHFGISPHHMHFPGTISLTAETFTQVLMDVARSLYQHGIRRFLFVNGHGGNRPALTIAMNRLRHELGVRAAVASPTTVAADIIKERVSSPITGHACESEMSQVLYLYPQAMKKERAEKGKIREEIQASYGKLAVEEGRFWEELTENGALGDATLATAELGKEVIEVALDRLTEFLRRFMES
ncbi:MAG: creatininase family protein [Bacillota bacterium]